MIFDNRILNAESGVYRNFAVSFEGMFLSDMGRQISSSPFPFLNDMWDFGKLFGGIYVDSLCILPNAQGASGPTMAQYNHPEVCYVANNGQGRAQIATLANPEPSTEGEKVATLNQRRAKEAQAHGSEICFQAGGQAECTLVISFIIAPTWRDSLGSLSSTFTFLRQLADRAGSTTSTGSWRSQYSPGAEPSVSAVPTIKVVTMPGGVPSGTAALRPFLSLVAAAAVAFFL